MWIEYTKRNSTLVDRGRRDSQQIDSAGCVACSAGELLPYCRNTKKTVGKPTCTLKTKGQLAIEAPKLIWQGLCGWMHVHWHIDCRLETASMIAKTVYGYATDTAVSQWHSVSTQTNTACMLESLQERRWTMDQKPSYQYGAGTCSS